MEEEDEGGRGEGGGKVTRALISSASSAHADRPSEGASWPAVRRKKAVPGGRKAGLYLNTGAQCLF